MGSPDISPYDIRSSRPQHVRHPALPQARSGKGEASSTTSRSPPDVLVTPQLPPRSGGALFATHDHGRKNPETFRALGLVNGVVTKNGNSDDPRGSAGSPHKRTAPQACRPPKMPGGLFHLTVCLVDGRLYTQARALLLPGSQPVVGLRLSMVQASFAPSVPDHAKIQESFMGGGGGGGTHIWGKKLECDYLISCSCMLCAIGRAAWRLRRI